MTAANAPTAHPLLQPVPPARSQAAADCDSRVLGRRLGARPRMRAMRLPPYVRPFLPPALI